MIRRPPRSTPLYSSAASDVYKRQILLVRVLRHLPRQVIKPEVNTTSGGYAYNHQDQKDSQENPSPPPPRGALGLIDLVRLALQSQKLQSRSAQYEYSVSPSMLLQPADQALNPLLTAYPPSPIPPPSSSVSQQSAHNHG